MIAKRKTKENTLKLYEHRVHLPYSQSDMEVAMLYVSSAVSCAVTGSFYGVNIPQHMNTSGRLDDTFIRVIGKGLSRTTELEFPYFSALLYVREMQLNPASWRHLDAEAMVKKICKGEFFGNSYDSVDGGVLYNALVKGCCNPYLKNEMGSRIDMDDRLNNFDFEFCRLGLYEFDGTKACGVRKSWLARKVVKKVNDTLDPDSPEYLTSLSSMLSYFYRDGLYSMMKTMASLLSKKSIVKAQQVLKPAKILQAAFPEVSKDVISAAAGFVADELRQHGEGLLKKYHFLVEYDDISSVYGTPNVSEGSLGQSCMRKDETKGRFFQIYDDGWEQSGVLYLLNEEGLLIGRALIHDEVHSPEVGCIKLMDRIYFSNNEVLAAFKVYAKKHGYWRKVEQRLGEDNYVSPDGKVERLVEMWIPCEVITEGMYDHVPYIDTFPHYCENTPGKMWSCTSPDRGGWDMWHTAQSTTGYDSEGFFTSGKGTICCCCNEAIPDGGVNEVDGEMYCNDCFYDNFSVCDVCGDVVSNDEAHYIDSESIVICGHCARTEFEECALCHELVRASKAVRFIDKNGDEAYICEGCAESDDRVYRCENCGELYHVNRNEVVYIDDDEECWCEDCANSYATRCDECGRYFKDEDSLREGEGNKSDRLYCPDCYRDIFEEGNYTPKMKIYCSCYVDENGIKMKDACHCSSRMASYQECQKRLKYGVMSFGDSVHQVICKECGQPIYNWNDNYIDEHGFPYHKRCWLDSKKVHSCEVCEKYHSDVYAACGESMCDHCKLTQEEGYKEWNKNLYMYSSK